jgi:hypothetical protein
MTTEIELGTPRDQVKSVIVGWQVKLDGNPELVVPTERQRSEGVKLPRSEAEAWDLYAKALGITATIHPYTATPVYE